MCCGLFGRFCASLQRPCAPSFLTALFCNVRSDVAQLAGGFQHIQCLHVYLTSRLCREGLQCFSGNEYEHAKDKGLEVLLLRFHELASERQALREH